MSLLSMAKLGTTFKPQNKFRFVVVVTNNTLSLMYEENVYNILDK